MVECGIMLCRKLVPESKIHSKWLREDKQGKLRRPLIKEDCILKAGSEEQRGDRKEVGRD